MLILASTSATRLQLLQNVGLTIRALAPDINEKQLQSKHQALTPAEMAKSLAAAKALSLSRRFASDIVIGADQTLDLQGLQFHKPTNIGEARTQLMALRGKTHTLTSAIACAENGQVIWQTSEQAHLTMRHFTPDFLEAYLTKTSPQIFSSLGAYQLENDGAQLFQKIEGDYFTILGFPLLQFLQFLRSKDILPT